MPLSERRRLAEGLRRAVEQDDVASWFLNQLSDLFQAVISPEPATVDA